MVLPPSSTVDTSLRASNSVMSSPITSLNKRVGSAAPTATMSLEDWRCSGSDIRRDVTKSERRADSVSSPLRRHTPRSSLSMVCPTEPSINSWRSKGLPAARRQSSSSSSGSMSPITEWVSDREPARFNGCRSIRSMTPLVQRSTRSTVIGSAVLAVKQTVAWFELAALINRASDPMSSWWASSTASSKPRSPALALSVLKAVLNT